MPIQENGIDARGIKIRRTRVRAPADVLGEIARVETLIAEHGDGGLESCQWCGRMATGSADYGPAHKNGTGKTGAAIGVANTSVPVCSEHGESREWEQWAEPVCEHIRDGKVVARLNRSGEDRSDCRFAAAHKYLAALPKPRKAPKRKAGSKPTRQSRKGPEPAPALAADLERERDARVAAEAERDALKAKVGGLEDALEHAKRARAIASETAAARDPEPEPEPKREPYIDGALSNPPMPEPAEVSVPDAPSGDVDVFRMRGAELKQLDTPAARAEIARRKAKRAAK